MTHQSDSIWSDTALAGEAIAALLPHAGKMVLLDRVTAWGTGARSPASPAPIATTTTRCAVARA